MCPTTSNTHYFPKLNWSVGGKVVCREELRYIEDLRIIVLSTSTYKFPWFPLLCEIAKVKLPLTQILIIISCQGAAFQMLKYSSHVSYVAGTEL